MPRSRSSKKPGCFSSLKPTLMFTESPPDRLPRRLCSPQTLADNPVTARVLSVEDGLETTWVSPQFHPNMFDQENPPKRRRRRQVGKKDGKSAMASQTTTRIRKPVLKVAPAAPSPSERRFPKGFKPLQFVSALPGTRRGDGRKQRMEEEEEEKLDDSYIDDDDGCHGDAMGRVKGNRRLQEGRRASRREKKSEASDENKMEDRNVDKLDGNRNNRMVDNAQRRSWKNKTGGRATRLKAASSSLGDSHYHHGDDFHNHCVNDDVDMLGENSALVCEDENNQRLTGEDRSIQESPKFDRTSRSLRDDPMNSQSLCPNSSRTLQDGEARNVDRRYRSHLLSETSTQRRSSHCGRSEETVLVTDTPEADYGLRVNVRRRRGLLPLYARERLLLDM